MTDPTGIAIINEEHREMLNLFDAFTRSIKEGAPVEETYEIVRQAIAIANAHFEHEERLGQEAGFPGAEAHKLLHRHLRMQMTTLAGHTVDVAVHDPVTEEHLCEMRRLLEEHIAGPDRELVEYLKKAGMR